MSIKQADWLKDIPLSPTRVMFAKCGKLVEAGEKVVALTLGEPDFDTPQYIKEACKKAIDEGHTKYVENTGIYPLRKAISDKLKRENHLDYSPNEIGVTTGAAQAVFAALLSFINPGDEILVPDPVYVTYPIIPHMGGTVVKRYHLKAENNFQADIAELESLVTEKTKMIVILSPSNPIGSIMRPDNLEKIAEVAKKHDLLVVADEIYERLTYDDKQEAVSIASFPGMKERTILINGFSKSMAMTGWRLGYFAAPEHLLEPMNRFAFYMTSGSVSFVQYAAVTALTEEDGSVERMRQEFQKRRDYFVGEINKMENFSCAMPEGAFYVFMNIEKTGLSSEAFCDYALDKYRLAMIPGNAFGESGEGFVRMSYATSMEILQEAVALLKKIDKDFQK